MADLVDSDLTCARCGGLMSRGFLNAGKGPFRWVIKPDQHKTIFGGEVIAKRHPLWGRRVVPAARCERCRLGVFAYDAV